MGLPLISGAWHLPFVPLPTQARTHHPMPALSVDVPTTVRRRTPTMGVPATAALIAAISTCYSLLATHYSLLTTHYLLRRSTSWVGGSTRGHPTPHRRRSRCP